MEGESKGGKGDEEFLNPVTLLWGNNKNLCPELGEGESGPAEPATQGACEGIPIEWGPCAQHSGLKAVYKICAKYLAKNFVPAYTLNEKVESCQV